MLSARILNGELQVRVGGGYMTIKEFVDKHSELETQRLKLKMSKSNQTLEQVFNHLLSQNKNKKIFNYWSIMV